MDGTSRPRTCLRWWSGSCRSRHGKQGFRGSEAGAHGQCLRLCCKARPLSRPDSTSKRTDARTISQWLGFDSLTDQDDVHVSWTVHPDYERHLDVSRTTRPGVETHVRRQSAASILPNGLWDRLQYPIRRKYRYVGRRQERHAASPLRTVFQHQAARLGDGPRSSREPDVRAPGYLPEVWKVVPESDLDASFSQRLVYAELVEVLNVPANE